MKKKSEKEVLNTKFQKNLRQKNPLLLFALIAQMKSIHLLTQKGERGRLRKQQQQKNQGCMEKGQEGKAKRK